MLHCLSPVLFFCLSFAVVYGDTNWFMVHWQEKSPFLNEISTANRSFLLHICTWKNPLLTCILCLLLGSKKNNSKSLNVRQAESTRAHLKRVYFGIIAFYRKVVGISPNAEFDELKRWIRSSFSHIKTNFVTRYYNLKNKRNTKDPGGKK